MPNRVAQTAVLLAFSTLTALAVAADPPARVGRVALAQGQVTIGSDVGAEMMAAQVNWPVTSGNTISTAAGSRTELRVGSTSIRLDGDSSLEVLQMDDNGLRLRLHYGSASVRVLNADVLAGFELETPQARVRLQQPGRMRVDAERVRDTSFVTVFDGTALVEDGDSQLTLRAGRRAEVGDADVRTMAAVRDDFDEWALVRDRYEDNAASSRYVTTEMTGYEDLDRYGSWREDPEYGPLWTPTVASTWVPYRDGSWTWLDPWGWTWVDNAPWGYAPFHYGRWVHVHNRWAWAPGRRHEHLVWAPALVGWVGGAGWNLTFRDRNRPLPAAGWYPLTPHDRYVPTWRAPDHHLRWLNEHVRDNPRRPRDYRPQGLTVLPQDRFGRPGRVNVPRTPITTVPPVLVHNVPAGAPPAAPVMPNRPNRPDRPDRPNRPDRPDRDGDGIRGPVAIGRMEGRHADPGRERRIETARAGRDGFIAQRPQGQVITAPPVNSAPAQGLPVTSPTPHLPPQPLSTVTSPTPHMPPQPLSTSSPTIQQPQAMPPAGVPPAWQRDRIDRERDRMERDARRDERRDQLEEWRRSRQPVQQAQPQPQPQPQPRIERPAPPPVQMAPRPAPAAAPTPAPAPPPVQMAPRQAPPPVQMAPRPAPVAAPAPAPAPARSEERRHVDQRGRDQKER
ncbi:DUF6600 domain-containing protein [Telluria sp. Tellsp131]